VKLLANEIENSNTFSVILSNRPKPVEGGNSTFHDITSFLIELNDWKQVIGQPQFSVQDYQIDKELDWGVNLRYTGTVNTLNDEEAKKALLMSMKFLKEILLIDVSEYENELTPTNNQDTIDIEKRY
jgi:hypothetical protein